MTALQPARTSAVQHSQSVGETPSLHPVGDIGPRGIRTPAPGQPEAGLSRVHRARWQHRHRAASAVHDPAGRWHRHQRAQHRLAQPPPVGPDEGEDLADWTARWLASVTILEPVGYAPLEKWTDADGIPWHATAASFPQEPGPDRPSTGTRRLFGRPTSNVVRPRHISASL